MGRIVFVVGGVPFTVPINPDEFDPVDSDGAEWIAGFNGGGRFRSYSDSRERVFTWRRLPAYDQYVEMIHTFEDYIGSTTAYVNLGDGLLPGLYDEDSGDWYQISVNKVETTLADGSQTIQSGGDYYNVYSTIELYFEILKEI